MVNVEYFSIGKNTSKNEDFVGKNDHTFVVADGATDISGRKYDGKTSGELASRLIVETCLNYELDGIKLIERINENMQDLYRKHENNKAFTDKRYRYISAFVSASVRDDRMIITQVGDTSFRLNGDIVYQDDNKLQEKMSKMRRNYIQTFGSKYDEDSEEFQKILVDSRKALGDVLENQYDILNNPNHELCFEKIDGFYVPKGYFYNIPLEDVKTLEMFTDGYFSIPKESTIDAWEKEFVKVEKEDPYKYKEYPSTKIKDDRTIMIVRF